MAESDCVKYWETIADNLRNPARVWAGSQPSIPRGRTIWIVDAHRDDGKRFVVRAEEKLTAFLELERACSLLRASPWEGQEIDCKLQSYSR